MDARDQMAGDPTVPASEVGPKPVAPHDMRQPTVGSTCESGEPEPESTERTREEAWQEGFASGHAEGLRLGDADVSALMGTVRQIINH